jgi:nucleoid-associated protein YgaU
MNKLALTFAGILLIAVCSPLYAEINEEIQHGINLFHEGKVDEATSVLDALLRSGDLNEYEKERVQVKLEKYREYARLQRQFKELGDMKTSVTASTHPTFASTSGAGLPDTYVVRKGDALWLIASYGYIYNDLTKGGLIYQANRDTITSPNLIYPNQVLRIKR